MEAEKERGILWETKKIKRKIEFLYLKINDKLEKK